MSSKTPFPKTGLLQQLFSFLSRLFSRNSSDSESPTKKLSDTVESVQERQPTSTNQISAHFTLAEATKSATADARGISNQPNEQELAVIRDTAQRMEQVRSLLGGKPILINSWFRNPAVNAAVGGSSTSDHMSGRSVDFRCPEYGTPLDICRKIAASGMDFDQLIFETNASGGQWVHIGFGQRMRRQVLTKKPNKPYQHGLIERHKKKCPNG